MSRTLGDKVFLVHDVGREWESEERIAWGQAQRTPVAPNGYRPATHDEEYEFQKSHPELTNLVALGSSTVYDDHRVVAVVWSGAGRRILGSNWFSNGWHARYRVLFVSK
jgi:hypothetical protein